MTSRNLEALYTEGFKEACASGQRPCFGWYEPRYLAGQVAARLPPAYATVTGTRTDGDEEADEEAGAPAELTALRDVLFPPTLTSSSFFPSPVALLEAGVLGSHGLARSDQAHADTSRNAAEADAVLTREEESLRVREAAQTARVLFQWTSPSTAEELFATGATSADGVATTKVPPARDYERLLLDQ